MLNTRKLTPTNYNNLSRDFQLLGFLFDSIINSSKADVDSILNFPYSKNIDYRFLENISRTLGFVPRHNYDGASLSSLCSSFKEIISKKGTIEALVDCINLLQNTQHLKDQSSIQIILSEELDAYLKGDSSGGVVPDDFYNFFNIDIYVPTSLQDISLLEDMLDYILPAGLTYSIIRSGIDETNKASTEIEYNDNVQCIKKGDSNSFGTINENIEFTTITPINLGDEK